MKHSIIFSTVFALLFISTDANLAQAECYGDAAEAYGCGAPAVQGAGRASRPSPSLERFGSTDGPVLPDLGYSQHNSDSDDIITYEERRKMMKSIILGRGGRSTASQQAHQQAINSSGRPLRRAQAMPSRTR